MKKQRKYFFTLVGLLALVPGQGHAAEIFVDAGGICTLAEAITSANEDNASGNGCVDGLGDDTIILETDVILDDPEEVEDARPPILSWVTIEGQGHTIDGNDWVGYVLKVGLWPGDVGFDITITDGYNLTLNNATITGGNHAHPETLNLPSNGGGIINAYFGELTLNNVTVSGNSAAGNGGGIFSSPSGILTLNNSTISGNTSAGNGGGIYIEDMSPYGEVTLNNVTISGNSAIDNGGGMYIGGLSFSGAGVVLDSSLISGNAVTGTSSEGDEIYIVPNLPITIPTIFGTIILTPLPVITEFNLFGHSGESDADAFYGFTPDSSDVNATSDGASSTALSGILSQLADNGGLTMTHALVKGGPAIDLDVEDCSAGLTEDQRGYPRPVGDGCDAGSFEFSNNLPIADAGEDQAVALGDVCLDGSASFDADGDPLTYLWELTEAPTSSTAELDDPISETPCFTADLPGSYKVSLVVNDGEEDSAPSIVEVTAEVITSPSEAIIATLEETSLVVSSLSPDDFDNKNKQKALGNQVDATTVLVDEELYVEALGKLQNSILGKTDGCVESGGPDKNDWIEECTSQEEVYDLVQEAIGILEEQM